jgi:hypothetical protein
VNVTDEQLRRAFEDSGHAFAESGQGSEVLLKTADENFSVFCLSKTAVSTQQWAYYGDSHAGICLEFELLEDCPWHRSGTKKWGAVKVQYSKERVCIDQGSFLNSDCEHVRESFYNMFYHKSENWKHEEEFRILLNQTKGLVEYPPSALTRVIFGTRTNPNDERFVRDLVRKSKANPYFSRIVLSNRDYRLAVVPA